MRLVQNKSNVAETVQSDMTDFVEPLTFAGRGSCDGS
jgi:hypothetical protein